VILHYHIFKNAGTTLQSILERNFGSQFAAFDSKNPDALIGNDSFLRFLEEHPDIAAVSSHNLRPPKPENEAFAFHDIVYLRHPLTRLFSMYVFYRRSENVADALTVEAKKLDIADFFRFLIENYPNHAMNPQVGYLANGGSKIPTDSELERAKLIASQAAILGVTDLFDLGAVRAEYLLRDWFDRRTILKRLDFSYAAENVSSELPRDLDVEVQKLREACGDSLFERLCELNALDISLVESVRKECYRRFQLTPDHQRRLKNLSARSLARERDVAMVVLASNHPHDFVYYTR
jgi:hypothetical protein